MNEELLEIGVDLEETFKELGWNVSDDEKAELTHKQWISRNIEKQKQGQVKRYSNPPMAYTPKQPVYSEPPTQAQLRFLTALKIPIEPSMTKKTASSLIKKRMDEDGKS